MSFEKGHVPWTKGKKLDEKYKEKISKSNQIITKKLWQNPKYRKLHTESIKLSHNTLEYKLKASESHKLSYQINPEIKEKIKNKLLGHPVSLKTKEKIRNTKKGVPSKKKGKSYEELFGSEKAQLLRQKLAELHRSKKLSNAHRLAISKGHKQNFEDEAYRKSFGQRFHRKPGVLEEKLISLINSNNLPFQYTGNGAFWIGNKNPDFKGQNGKNQVIELLGEYWHKKRPNIRFHQTAKGTNEHYQKAGFNCLIIWDYEVRKDPNAVLQKIKAFSESN